MDQLKNLVLGAVMGGMILEVIYALLRASPGYWWLWAAGILLLFTVVLANLAPILLFPLFYKFVPLGPEYAELVKRLGRLADDAGTHIQGVFKFDMSRRSTAANAALVGMGATRRIILADTLLDEFTPAIGIAAQSVLTLGGLYLVALGLRWGAGFLGLAGPDDIASFPLFVLLIGLYGLITMPLGNAFSRWRERRADQYALEVTGKGEAYAAALTRLANKNLSEADPEWWVEVLLYSHPALGKRIRMARQAAGSGSNR